ncbi:MAG TPA: hypothetical protein VFF98_17350, partial [Novosphingobium sp.]|nr:hypothetical protein [Novosphingobium sp.]
MTSLLDLMGQPQAPRCPRRPMWRAGVPVPGSDSGYVPHQDGDLRWLSTGWDGRRWRGAWYRWDARRAEWRPLDPANRLCINHL